MVQKITGFDKTFHILNEIDETLDMLKKVFEHKKENIKNIKNTAEQSVEKIDTLLSKLDKVLK